MCVLVAVPVMIYLTQLGLNTVWTNFVPLELHARQPWSVLYLLLGMLMVLGCVAVGVVFADRYAQRVYRLGKEAPRCWRCRYQLAKDWASVTQMSEVCPECGFATAKSRDLWFRYRPFSVVGFLKGAYRGWKELFVSLYRWCSRRSER